MQENQKVFFLRANMSLDTIATFQKTTPVGLFLALPQAKHYIMNVHAKLFGLRCAKINIGRLTNGIIFKKAASIRSARGKCIYVYALDDCSHVYLSISGYLFAY